jgi:hypothetical protein
VPIAVPDDLLMQSMKVTLREVAAF